MTVSFKAVSAYTPEHLRKNTSYSNGLGLPLVDSFEALGPLAIVGSGPSVAQYVYTLQRWQGPIWAINRSWKWCQDRGINATFFSIDPAPSISEMVDGADKAILGEGVDPSVFERVASATRYLYTGNLGGSTSVGAAIIGGIRCKRLSITLFGCEGCYQPDQSHITENFKAEDELVVLCNGMQFLTTARMLLGVLDTLHIMYGNPRISLGEQSGGLLRAMIETYGDYQITDMSPEFQKKHDIKVA